MTSPIEALISFGSDPLDHSQKKENFFSCLILLSWVMCLLVGKFGKYGMILSGVMLLCILASFFDDSIYLYAALFVFFRNRMVLGDTPVFRYYTYIMVLKFLIDLVKYKFRPAYLPMLFVFILHCIFASSKVNFRLSMNVIVDLMIMYIILMKVTADERLMRKFFMVFLLGGIGSGVYGMTAAPDVVSKSISIRGAGGHEVVRNTGSVGDANYAGMFYVMCTMTSVFIKKINPVVRIIFIGLFLFFILQTASLSALLTLALLSVPAIILKFRLKSIIYLTLMVVGAFIAIAVLLTVPQFKEIPAISGIIIRVTEKLKYISMGRWDLLTTDRSTIWTQALGYFKSSGTFGMLVGGSVITVMMLDTALFAYAWACHNSYIQSLLNFGILGTLMVFLSIFCILTYRIMLHFSKASGYGNEDLKIIEILFMLGFLVFGFTVDFFIDWAYLIFVFI